MYKLRLTGYALRPDSERLLARKEVGQLFTQGLTANTGTHWFLRRNADGTYCLGHTTKKETRTWAIEPQ